MADTTDTTENTQDLDTQQAKNNADEAQSDTKSVKDNDEHAKNGADQSKSAKTIEKLQKRISELSSNKNDTQSQLKKALATIEQMKKENGEKPDPEQALKAKDDEISSLKQQLDRVNRTNEARKIFAEAGQVVDDKILQMVVTNDKKTTLENIQNLLGYTDAITDTAKKAFYKDSTPRINTKKTAVKQDTDNIKDPVERLEAIKSNLINAK